MCIHACWRACMHTNGYVGMHGSTHVFTYARVIHVCLMLGCMVICLPTYSSCGQTDGHATKHKAYMNNAGIREYMRAPMHTYIPICVHACTPAYMNTHT